MINIRNIILSIFQFRRYVIPSRILRKLKKSSGVDDPTTPGHCTLELNVLKDPLDKNAFDCQENQIDVDTPRNISPLLSRRDSFQVTQ